MILSNNLIFGRKYMQHNTFIGGVSTTLNTKSLLATRLSISESRISLFEIVGSDIQCRISGSYVLPTFAFIGDSSITFYDDKEGMCTELKERSILYSNTNLRYLYFPNLIKIEESVSAFSLVNPCPNLRYVYVPKCVNFGNTQGLDNNLIRKDANAFQATAKWYISPLMQTSNTGGIEGDLAWLVANGNALRYVYNYIAPNSVSDLSVENIYDRAIKLNFTPPTSINGIDYYEVYINDIYHSTIKNSGELIAGLTPLTIYNIKLITVDNSFNKSNFSNVLSVLTNTTQYSILGTNGIASYRFENNFNDSFSTHNAIPISITYASGKVGQSTVFNGTNAYATIPDSDVFSFTDGINDNLFSISFNYKFASTATQTFANKRSNISSSCEWQMLYSGGNLQLILFDGGNNSNYINFTHSFTPTLGTWYHITYTYDALGTAKIYVNAISTLVNKNTVGTYTKMINTTSSVVIGKRGYSSSDFANGEMDNLNFHNKELTQAEITYINDTINAGNNLI